jgi:hypothetical protein
MSNKADDKDERRKSQRIRRHHHAEVRVSAKEKASAQIMNISEGGVRLITAIEIPLKNKFTLVVDGKEVPCLVHECKKLFNGFAVRAEFVG